MSFARGFWAALPYRARQTIADIVFGLLALIVAAVAENQTGIVAWVVDHSPLVLTPGQVQVATALLAIVVVNVRRQLQSRGTTIPGVLITTDGPGGPGIQLGGFDDQAIAGQSRAGNASTT